jgi:predicted dehydrogenase
MVIETDSEGRPLPLRAAVVGCGAIAHEHLRALADLERARIVGVCDTSPALAELVGSMYGSDAWFDDLDTMLDRARPDVLHVLTPPHTHPPLVDVALRHGCHVVCEKPLALDPGDLEGLLRLASDQRLLLIESQNLRYNDNVIAIDRLIDSGDIGSVREVDVSLCLDLTAGPFGDLDLSQPLRLPGGAVQDFLPHLVYLFLHFATADTGSIEEVQGMLANRSGNRRVGYDSLDVLVSAGGVRGRLHVASDVAPDAFRLRVRGTQRSVETDFYSPYLRVEGGANIGKRAPLEQITSGSKLVFSGLANLRDKVMRHDTMHGLPRMIDRFYLAVADGAEAPITPATLTATAHSIERILHQVQRLDAEAALEAVHS